MPGIATYEAMIPAGLLAGLRQRAAELAVPLSSVLLAAHAKVLAVLSGEPDVVTGYLAAARGLPLPCRLATGPGSWRTLLLRPTGPSGNCCPARTSLPAICWVSSA